MSWEHLDFDATAFFLAACYAALTIAALFLQAFHRKWRDDPSYTVSSTDQRHSWPLLNACATWFSSRLAFTIFLVLGTSVRCLYFVLAPFQQEDDFDLDNAYDFFLNTVSSFFFLSAYSVMLYAWGQLYWRADLANASELLIEQSFAFKSDSFMRKFLLGANVVMYVGCGIAYTVDLVEAPAVFHNHDVDIHISTADTPRETAILIMSSVLYVLSSIGFFVYGYTIFMAKHREQHGVRRSRAQRMLLRKIFWMAAVIMLAFIVRAALIIVQLKVRIAGIWYAIGPFYVFLELLPLCLMMYVIATRDPARHLEAQYGSKYNSRNSQTLYASYEPLLG